MRKLYFLSLLILGASAANAQFTLTSANHGLVSGNTITYHNFNSIPNFSTNGAGVTWDFSAKTFDTTNPLTEVYTGSLASYHSSTYPGTNLMMYDSGNDTTFYRQTTDSLIITGLHFTSTPQPLKLPFTNPALVLKFPYDYTMAVISDPTISGLGVTGNSTTDIDSYGTLKLSSGSYSTIRTVFTINMMYQGFISIQIKDFTWFIQSQRNPIMKIRTIDVSGTRDTVAMANSLYTGIKENQSLNSKFSVYPNPAKDNAKINIQLDKPGTTSVEIYSNTGAKVFSQEMGMLSAGTHSLDLNTKNVAAGVYMVRIISNEETGTQRLVVE